MTGLMADGNGAGGGRRRILKLKLLSLLPVTLAAIFNSGYQYLNGLAEAPASGGDDFRGRLASGLASSFENPGVYDYFAVGLAHLLPMLLLALLVGGLWERIIAGRCRRPVEPSFILVALLFTLLMPGAAPFTHIVFGMSFAILLGKGIFGGDGKSFLSPALLGVAIVQVSFAGASGSHPLWNGIAGYAGSDAFAVYHRGGEAALAQADINLWSAFFGAIPGPMGTTSLLAVALGAALLLITRVIAWRLLAAQLIGLIVIVTLVNWMGAGTGIGALPAYWHLLLGSFAFGAVFLGCDPVASACTNPGRWIQGFLIAALVVLIRVANPIHPDAVIPALLLASILAPLIDHAVIAWNIRQRARRHV
jgi:Na+-transporting NADH:ubiquinone oxidoreductase subunit B